MEQKKIEHAARLERDDNFQVEAVKQLLYTLGSLSAEQLSEQLMGFDGLQLLPSAVHSTPTDYGGTTPSATSEAIAEAASGLYGGGRRHRFLTGDDSVHPVDRFRANGLVRSSAPTKANRCDVVSHRLGCYGCTSGTK